MAEVNVTEGLRKEKDNKTTLLTQVGNIILQEIGSPEQNSSRIDTAVTLATQLYQDLGVTESFLDESNPESWDRAFLAVALADQISNSEPEDRERYRKVFPSLFPESWERSTPVEKLYVRGTNLGDLAAVIKYIYKGEVLDTADNREVVNFIRQKADRGVLRLPYSFDIKNDKDALSGKDLLDNAYNARGLPLADRSYPEGLANRFNKFAVLWQDGAIRTEFHERNHLENDGLRIGGLGSFLDEGMTECLALIEEQRLTGKDIDTLIQEANYYENEVQIIRDLHQYFPDLGNAIDNHYKVHSVESSQLLARMLIRSQGIEGYSMIYTFAELPKDIEI